MSSMGHHTYYVHIMHARNIRYLCIQQDVLGLQVSIDDRLLVIRTHDKRLVVMDVVMYVRVYH